MKKEQILNCSFANWYDTFKQFTFRSEIIPLDSNELAYLRSDSTIILPKSCQDELDSEAKHNRDEFDVDSTDWSEDQDGEQIEYPNFPQLDEKINDALNKFNRKVFIKLNWSSPKDAYWSLSKLFCNKLSDVYILLKSSDFISHDLNEPFKDCDDENNVNNDSLIKYSLIIREWININPNMEFRCFVHLNQMIGISQRDCRTFYQILIENKKDIQTRIETFFKNNIYKKFFDHSYVFDVCLGKKIVKLVDFNPFGSVTDSLLFSWDELTNRSLNTDNNEEPISDKCEFRLIESDLGIHSNQYSLYSQPKESIDTILNYTEQLTELVNENIKLQDKEDDF